MAGPLETWWENRRFTCDALVLPNASRPKTAKKEQIMATSRESGRRHDYIPTNAAQFKAFAQNLARREAQAAATVVIL